MFFTKASIIADNMPFMKAAMVILGRLMLDINLTIAANIKDKSFKRSGMHRYEKKYEY